MKISCVIWDYDGTLADTRLKNLNVTRAILSKILNDADLKFTTLDSLENYELANNRTSNWKELYRKEFGLDENQIDYAGSLWTQFQLMDKTEVQLFEGINFTVRNLSAFPQGIVSQNSSEIIRNNLKRYTLEKYFNHIIGYEEVDFSKQKPNPEGLLKCITEITTPNDNDTVLYIGDHITDVECAKNANDKMGRKSVISILLNYSKSNLTEGWNCKPDYIINHPSDVLKIIDKILNV